MKLKSNSNTPVGTENNKSASKIKTPKSVKSSPELNLGLKLEQLLEKGVKVKTVDHENSSTPKKLKSVEKSNKVKKNSTPKKGKLNALANVEADSSMVQNTMASIKQNSQNAEVLPKRKKFSKVVSSGVVSKRSKKKKIKKQFVIIDGVKCRKPKLEVETSTETRVKLSKVKEAAKGLLEHQANKAKQNGLLDEPEKVQIQLSVVKKGQTPFHGIRFALPHPIISKDDDVCLFVCDQFKNSIERTINFYKDLLEEKGIHHVKQIITFKQLKTEYFSFETRRKLCNSYDFFITDCRLSRVLLTKLGKPFLQTRKYPLSVDLQSKNLKTLIEKAISKVTMKISDCQDMFACDVGHTGFSVEQISENVLAVVKGIDKEKFPGGWKNVRLVTVKTCNSPIFPIFFSTLSPNEIDEPIIAPKRPYAAVPATGELTTSDKRTIVKVLPEGTVQVQSSEKEEDGDDDDDDDDDDVDNDKMAIPGNIYLVRKRTHQKQSQGSNGTNKKFKASKMETESDDKDDVEDEDNSDDNDKGGEDSDDNDKGEDSDDNDKGGEDSDDDVGAKAEEQYLKGLMDDSWATESDEESNEKTPKQKTESIIVKNKFGLAQQLNKKLNNSVKQKEEDTDDDDDEDDDDDDEDDGWDTESDESEETEEDVATATPDSKKRKLPQENETSPSKKTKQAKNEQVKNQNTKVIKKKGKGTFDTRLGETWTVKKKQQAASTDSSTNQNDGKKKKNKKNKKHKKLNKNQRKAKIKTATKKNKKR